MEQNFNTYKEGLDLEFLREYCMKHGTPKTFHRGEALESEGSRSRWLGFIVQGCFKYMVHNKVEQKDYITGFAFTDEFVGDFPNCMESLDASVSIVAQTTSKVFLIDGKVLESLIKMDKPVKDEMSDVYKHLFLQIYSQHLDSYRLTVKERYMQLLGRCPQIVQQINLKDIASFLKVTPTTISKIRKEITFSA
jgi:CRP-like cAMP-binding protein